MGNKRTCGLSVPASCVPWVSGPLYSFNFNTLCDPRIDEIIVELDKVIHEMQVSLDLTKINAGCDAPLKATHWYEVATQQYAEICTLKAAVSALALKLSQINFGNITLPVNLYCLSGQYNTGLLTILQLFDLAFSKLCEHDGRLNELDPSTANGNLLYQP